MRRLIAATILPLLLTSCSSPALFFIDPYIEQSKQVTFSAAMLRSAMRGASTTVLSRRLSLEEDGLMLMSMLLEERASRKMQRIIATPLLAAEFSSLAPQYPDFDFWLLTELSPDSSLTQPPNMRGVNSSRKAAFAQLSLFLDELLVELPSPSLLLVVYRRNEKEREEIRFLEEQLLQYNFKSTLHDYTTLLDADTLSRERDIILSGIYDVVIVLLEDIGISILEHNDAAESALFIGENMNASQAELINRSIIASINYNWIGALQAVLMLEKGTPPLPSPSIEANLVVFDIPQIGDPALEENSVSRPSSQ